MDVRLPRLGEGADSGIVASIFVKEGDRVTDQQPILELESEKAVAQIPSPGAGTVSRIHVKEGDQVKVGQLILSLDTASGASQAPAGERVLDLSVGDTEETEGPPAAATQAGPEMELSAAEALPPVPEGIPPAASPSVRRLARELGIDLARVRGSERGGRVVMADLRQYVQRLQTLATRKATQPSAPPQAAKPSPDLARWGPVHREKLTTLRKTISTRMSESWQSVPRVTQFDEVDLTTILALKKNYDAVFQAKGARLTLTAFALKAVAETLRNHPVLRAGMDQAAGDIVIRDYYHIGVAVDTEEGLIVPVIRNVDAKTLLELAVELADLAERTRTRKVALEEMQGGTFTISNQGGIGSGAFTPIVNIPEVAILGMGRGTVRPVTVAGAIESRTIMPVSLSYDHRVVDGANAARFMVDLVRAFEQFSETLLTAGQ